MAEIKPFKGLLYNPAKVGDLNKVMAPPYDVISPKKQDELYSRHPNNIIRLILGKTGPDDKEGSDRYSRAADELKRWIGTGVLVKDEKPSIYYYNQSYKLKDGSVQTRKGFIALSKLQDFGKGIHPHEKTLSGPKADRLKLMQACNVNLSCIFSLYSDPSLKVNRALNDGASKAGGPIIDVSDDDGTDNRVWRIDDPLVISSVSESMRDKALFIADGHHRYETALNYRNMMREKENSPTGHEPYNYVMMYFSNMDDEGMTIWPTHRIIHSLKGFEPSSFTKQCAEYFDTEEFPFNSNEASARSAFLKKLEAEGGGKTAFGLRIMDKNSYFILTMKTRDMMDKVFGDKIPDVFKNLDVTVLHSLILSKILGITQEAQEKQENLIYVKSYDEALGAMNKGGNQLVFLLNPTRIEQVKAVALAGFVMPQKSTYFYPKLLSGLVINLLSGKNSEEEPAKV